MTLGFVILAAEVALCLYVLTPAFLAYRRLDREWTDLVTQVDALRADIDANRAACRSRGDGQ